MFASQAALATLLFPSVHQAEGPPVVKRQLTATTLPLRPTAKWPHYNPFATRESKLRAPCRLQNSQSQNPMIFIGSGLPAFRQTFSGAVFDSAAAIQTLRMGAFDPAISVSVTSAGLSPPLSQLPLDL
jgi:hypothetical protein